MRYVNYDFTSQEKAAGKETIAAVDDWNLLGDTGANGCGTHSIRGALDYGYSGRDFVSGGIGRTVSRSNRIKNDAHGVIFYSLIKSCTTVPAIISPATEGTQATLAGTLRRPGGGVSR